MRPCVSFSKRTRIGDILLPHDTSSITLTMIGQTISHYRLLIASGVTLCAASAAVIATVFHHDAALLPHCYWNYSPVVWNYCRHRGFIAGGYYLCTPVHARGQARRGKPQRTFQHYVDGSRGTRRILFCGQEYRR
jgi:hypothetical protein